MADMNVTIVGSGFPTSALEPGCLNGIGALLNQSYTVNIPGNDCAEIYAIHTDAGWSLNCDNTWQLPAQHITEFGYGDWTCASLSPCIIKNISEPTITVKFGPANAFQDASTPGATSITVTYTIPVLRELERFKTKANPQTIIYMVEDQIQITAQNDTISATNCTTISSQSLTLQEAYTPEGITIDITGASVQVSGITT